ncbi:hypothetical protein [Baekduia sp.]|uniref:hypothetical protein n=1 Tax=Baekduia sp. TaxID=2600305 RepID=UPI002DFA3E7D|nr:hypothetical protein [Baekduia sp.]
MDLQAGWRYLAIIWRRKWIVVPLVVIPTAAAFFLSHKQERMYQGTAEVLLQRQNLANALTNLPDPSTGSTDAIRLLETQASVARSINVAKLVVAADPDVGVSADEVLARSKVAAERNADLLEFSVENPDPAKAVRLSNLYAKAFTVYRGQLDTRAVQTAIRSVNKKLEGLRSESSTLHDSLEEKKEQLDTLQALQTSNATVVNPARAAVKTAPRTKRNVAAGFVLGCVLALLIALALESRPPRARPAEPLPDEQRPHRSHTEQLV